MVEFFYTKKNRSSFNSSVIWAMLTLCWIVYVWRHFAKVLCWWFWIFPLLSFECLLKFHDICLWIKFVKREGDHQIKKPNWHQTHLTWIFFGGGLFSWRQICWQLQYGSIWCQASYKRIFFMERTTGFFPLTKQVQLSWQFWHVQLDSNWVTVCINVLVDFLLTKKSRRRIEIQFTIDLTIDGSLPWFAKC